MAAPELASVDDDRLLALVEVLYLAATADGEFGDDERAHFEKSMRSLCEERMTGERLSAVLATLEGDVARDGREARFASLRARLPEAPLKRAAIELAVRLFAADGVFRTSEREALVDLADALAFDRDQAADIVRTLAG